MTIKTFALWIATLVIVGTATIALGIQWQIAADRADLREQGYTLTSSEVLAKVQNLKVVTTKQDKWHDQAKVSWTPVEGQRYYTARASHTRDFKRVTERVRGTSTSVVLHDLKPGRTYYVQVAVADRTGHHTGPWRTVKVQGR